MQSFFNNFNCSFGSSFGNFNFRNCLFFYNKFRYNFRFNYSFTFRFSWLSFNYINRFFRDRFFRDNFFLNNLLGFSLKDKKKNECDVYRLES